MTVPINKLNGLSWTEEDLQKKFSGSYVLASTLKEGVQTPPEVYYIASAAEGGNRVLIHTDDQKEVIFRYKDFLIVEDRPPKCTTNVGDSEAVVFRYDPQRQWRRGVGHYNCYFYWAPSLLPQGGKGYTHAHGPQLPFETAKAVYRPKTTPLDDAISQMRGNANIRGRAITAPRQREYLLVRDGSALKLYRDRTLMGSFTGSKFFSMEEAGRLFTAELKEELPSLKDKYAFARKSAARS